MRGCRPSHLLLVSFKPTLFFLSYVIDARTKGSAISLGSTVAPLFKQLGIYEEFASKGKRNLFIDTYNESRERSFIMDFEPVTEM